MAEQKLDAVLLFAQESMYWLTGYDTFGYCFFQCLVVKADGEMVLMTRSADLRQARHTSTIDNIVVWTDRQNANPAVDLRNILNDLDLLGCTIGVEYDTHGLTGRNAHLLDDQLKTFGTIADISGLVGNLRLARGHDDPHAPDPEAGGLLDRDGAARVLGRGLVEPPRYLGKAGRNLSHPWRRRGREPAGSRRFFRCADARRHRLDLQAPRR
jgi:hypothetical protein